MRCDGPAQLLARNPELEALQTARRETLLRQQERIAARFMTVVATVSGVGIILSLAGALPSEWNAGIWLGVTTTATGALQLVFRKSGFARPHEPPQSRCNGAPVCQVRPCTKG